MQDYQSIFPSYQQGILYFYAIKICFTVKKKNIGKICDKPVIHGIPNQPKESQALNVHYNWTGIDFFSPFKCACRTMKKVETTINASTRKCVQQYYCTIPSYCPIPSKFRSFYELKKLTLLSFISNSLIKLILEKASNKFLSQRDENKKWEIEIKPRHNLPGHASVNSDLKN